MRFGIFCLAGLNKSMLRELRFEALERLPFRDILSTHPPFPITAWTSVWTGADPAVHGKVPGIKGKFPKLPDVFDAIAKQGLSLGEYEEIDLTKPADDVDIGIFRIESIADFIMKDELDNARDMLIKLDRFIDKMPCPFMIISAYGATKYRTALNVDKFLGLKGFMSLNGSDLIKYEETTAYPANYRGKKPRLTFGININTKERANGFVEGNTRMEIQGNLMLQLNRVDGITALPGHQVYDFNGEFFSDLPDIVLKSPAGFTYYRCAGQTDEGVVSAYYKYDLSENGMIAGFDPEVISKTDSVFKAKAALISSISGLKGGG